LLLKSRTNLCCDKRPHEGLLFPREPQLQQNKGRDLDTD
jgi:hypothetical protein